MTTELRCSPAIRNLGVDPVGSAPAGTSYVVIDVPLPWQHDLSADPRLDDLLAGVSDLWQAGHKWNVQATVPTDSATRRIVAYQLPDEEFVTGYRRREVVVPVGDEVGRALELMRELSAEPIGAEASGPGADLLLCTHGARDVCCGGPGTALWKELSERVKVLPEDVVLHRTSHTGGHRFAPTAILLPNGTVWAWLDASLVRAVTHRTGPIEDVLPHYRGSCLFPVIAEQVVDREVLRQVGWEWLDTPRRGSSTTTDVEGEKLVELSYRRADGTSGTWSARTKLVGKTPVPKCGEPVADAPKFSSLWEVVGDVVHTPG